MNREMGLFEALASDGAYNVCVIIRGELAIAAHLRAAHFT